MDDRMRVSDADRDRVTGRLREHFAEGRLSQDELDERVTAALHAKTFGELRPLTADLPEHVPFATASSGPARPGGPGGRMGPWGRRRGPRFLPLMLLGFAAVLLIPSASWLAFTFFKFFAVFWLLACVAGFLLARARWRMIHHHWQDHDHHSDDWRGYGRQ